MPRSLWLRNGMIIAPSRRPISAPSAIPAPMTMACSSHTSVISWRIENPTVRISPNCISRSRNDTYECTRNPRQLSISTAPNAMNSSARQPACTSGSTAAWSSSSTWSCTARLWNGSPSLRISSTSDCRSDPFDAVLSHISLGLISAEVGSRFVYRITDAMSETRYRLPTVFSVGKYSNESMMRMGTRCPDIDTVNSSPMLCPVPDRNDLLARTGSGLGGGP